jgi:hypothetical protein
MVKQRTFILALAAALLMVLLVGSVASADGNETGVTSEAAKGEVCVDGYVINHREQPVDGTKTQPPLVVEAVRGRADAATDATVAAAAVANVDKNGYFKFSNLPAGSYNFRMLLPKDWEGIVPEVRLGGLAETGFTTFKKSSTCYRIVFKVRRLTTITVLKWEEQLNGTVVPGQDWKITATPVNDPFAKTIEVTVTNGQALLTLTPGTWNVTETLKSGWVAVTPSTVQRVVDQYQVGAVAPIVFKNRVPVCYSKLTVIKQGVGTNSKGKDEPLGTLAGWTFTLSAVDGSTTSVTKTTGGDGQVVFENILPGVYTVTETVQPGWKISESSQTVAIRPCETPKPLTFVNHELIGQRKIYGTKWFKAWEPPYKGTLIGLPGWTITATLVGGEDLNPPAQPLVTTTDALGNYEFSQQALESVGMGFPGASIEVCEEERDHWIAKTPVCVTVKFPYPVPPDYTGAKVDFTNVQDPPLTSSSATTYRAPARSGSCSVYYTVKPGDTLAKIASRYGVTGSSIIRANNIRDADLIYLGQRLCLGR